MLTEADVGRHLKATDWAVGVMEWIGELQDRTLAALPRRALWNDGRIFVPTAESASGETFWLHVVTDQSAEQAEAWVRYLAAQPPSAALGFTSPEHRLFEAVRAEPPQLGGAALAVRLLHGNAGRALPHRADHLRAERGHRNSVQHARGRQTAANSSTRHRRANQQAAQQQKQRRSIASAPPSNPPSRQDARPPPTTPRPPPRHS